MSLRGGPEGTDAAIRFPAMTSSDTISLRVIARRSPRDRRGNPFPAMTSFDTVSLHVIARRSRRDRRGDPAFVRADFFIQGDPAAQERAFAEQLGIASDLGRCVNVHNIGCDGKTVSLLKDHGKGCRSIILHSYKSPDIRPFLGTDCYYSVNPRILSKSRENIVQIISQIPKDRLLLESDYPYATKDFVSMEDFVTMLAGILGTDSGSLADTAADNLRRTIR